MWDGWPACPCGCGAEGLKLAVKTGHVARACRCRSCIGRRSQKKGRRAQTVTHQRLGGVGPSTRDEESARPYIIEACVLPEVKTGSQVPRQFHAAMATDWFRRAFSQSERAIPAGSGALPCVVIDGVYAVVRIDGRQTGGDQRG